MSVQWTKEQQKVIDLRNRNILVSAAAGSGKTAVLVERIITMLTKDENPIDVDRLLIVTFTEAAASEMKERIRDAIEKKLEEEPENEHLMHQATLIHNARITTIHSFCLSVIRDHFHAIDLDPGFRIGEEGELKLIKHDVLGEILEEKYARGEERFLDFSSAYGGRNDKKLEELVLKIYEYSRSYPDPASWLDDCVNAYQIADLEGIERSPHMNLIVGNIYKYLDDIEELILHGLEVCSEENGPYLYIEALESDLVFVRALAESESYLEMSEKARGFFWEKLKPNKDKNIDVLKAEQVKDIREEVKKLVKSLLAQYFYQSPEEMIADLRLCRPAIEELTDLVKIFAQKFEEKKRAQNLIDFSDMEQYALRILSVEAIAKEYRQMFQEIMLDEYQDSNLIQEAILTSVSRVPEGKYNIFMVGDVKQSIYRFRLSRPELFMEKYNTYTLLDGNQQRVDLHKNFRSRKDVLDSVNFIFRQIMTKSLGGITYDDQAALYPGADYPEGENLETEMLFISTQTEVPSEKYEAVTDREWEARLIAGKIRSLMESQQVFDKKSGKMRKACYSDIVILCRSIQGTADVISEVLNREGIPAHVTTREGYFSTPEIGGILEYLQVLNNRKQDIPLASVLSSSFGKLTAEEMAVIKSDYKEESFYQAVMNYRINGSNDVIRGKLEKCLGQMEHFHKQVSYTPMHELLWMICDETGYADFVAAMPGGEQRAANLEMLIEKARAFEATSYKGLFHFIRYIEQLKKYDVDYGEANIEDEQADTIRIMTIHKSKGLEFPIVFVAGMGKKFNMQDARSAVVLHPKLGVGLDAVNMETRMKTPSIIKKVIQMEEVLDTLSEELRILYVAMTRAKEKLIITGTVTNWNKVYSANSLVKDRKTVTLAYEQISKAVTYLDWFAPAVIRLEDDSFIRVSLLTLEDIISEEVKTEVNDRIEKEILEKWDAKRVYDEKVHDQIEEQFSYKYPFADDQNQKLKFTVSELKKMIHEEEAGEMLFEEEEAVPLLPKFLQEEEELTGASRGTAYHRLMELIDFEKKYDYELLENGIKRYVSEGKMTEEMGKCIRRKDILKFIECEAGQRMSACAKNGRLWREQPFVLGVEAREIYPQEQEGELLLVQGIIDAYFEEEDGLVVLDYKTDKVFKEEELVERYHGQLDYYAKALEQLRGKKVKEKMIYSFTLGKLIMV